MAIDPKSYDKFRVKEIPPSTDLVTLFNRNGTVCLVEAQLVAPPAGTDVVEIPFMHGAKTFKRLDSKSYEELG